MKENYLEPNGLYYKTNDFKSDRPTLVFIHGLSGSSSAWSVFEKKLADKYNLLFFDLRGHGKSFKPKLYKSYKIENFSDDLYKIIKYLNLNNFILISHSFGSLVALDFLKKHQALVKAVVFLSPSFYVSDKFLAKLLRKCLFFTHFLDLLPVDLKIKGELDYTKYQGTGDWNLRRTWADVTNTSWRVYLYTTKQSYNADFRDFIEQINLPTLIIHGKQDSIFSVNNSLIMSQKIKNSKLIVLEKADHILVLNHSDEILPELVDFINSLNN